DVNSDGKPDLITKDGQFFSAPVNLLLGNGDGTFQSPQTLPGVEPWVTVADVNSDGKPDLIVGNTVFLGNGDGTFRKLHTSTGALGDVVDVNGDGKPDIITTNNDFRHHSTIFSVLLGNGDGTFQPGREVAKLSDAYASLLAVADVNGDGRP